MSHPKVAIVHDWLTNMGGAEPVVLELHKLFPNAPIYTSVFDKKNMPAFKNIDVRTTYLQKILPKSLRYKHVLWPVLRAFAFRRLDLSEYDIIISSSSAEAKAVNKRPGAIHICYCHTPTRYYWSHYQEFKNEFNFGVLTPFIRPFIPLFVAWMRRLDLAAAKRLTFLLPTLPSLSNASRSTIEKTVWLYTRQLIPSVSLEKIKRVEQVIFSGGGMCRTNDLTWRLKPATNLA